MSDLFKRSVEIILDNQAASGAYMASPNFPTYRYSWYRDNSFIAYAMDLVGEHQSAARFHDWAASNIVRRSDVIERALDKASRDEVLLPEDVLHTRYDVNGDPASEEWPNFQLDGFGTWLWSLGEHIQLAGKNTHGTQVKDQWLRAAGLVADYLTALWDRPCYDCWEEFPEKVHPHTLAAIYGGLLAHQSFGERDHSEVLESLRKYVCQHAVMNNHFVKFEGTEAVDASLLGLSIPYKLVPENEPLMTATVASIEKTLRRACGGVHRYPTDSYYGGGEWVLLTAWLGWYYAQIGETGIANELREWIEGQADSCGNLPEQVADNLIVPNYLAKWEERWGPAANPLIWSHAMYLILCEAL